jgi:hypothetical protein
MEAMRVFGMPPGLSLQDLASIDGPPPTGFRFGRRPFAVDLLTSVRGVDFDGIAVRVIGRAAPLKNKRATQRLKDAADVEELERLAEDE